MYFFKTVSSIPRTIHGYATNAWSPTKILVFACVMAALAAILQSAGAYLPIIGFIISPFATLPILISIVISYHFGLLTYLLTIILLMLIGPSELFIFPFTTGLLGVSLGWGFRMLNQRWMIIVLNGCMLFAGICFPLYILGFPALGVLVSSFGVLQLLGIFIFSILYSWLWLELGLFFFNRLKIILLKGW